MVALHKQCLLLRLAFAVALAHCACPRFVALASALPCLPVTLPTTVKARPWVCVLRGGSSTAPFVDKIKHGTQQQQQQGTETVTSAEETLRKCLEEDSTSQAMGKFHIQGWRWHTMSVAREAERLQKLAFRILQQEEERQATGDIDRDNNLELDDLGKLQKAADYVVDFNMKALHRVEAMFFPFIKQGMDHSKIASAEMKTAFHEVVNHLQEDQRKLAELGSSITNSLTAYSKSRATSISTQNAARIVASQSGALVDLTRSMLDREKALVIPAVGMCVPEEEQKKFNNQVIKFLGVLESRCHLVHMHEVVAEANSATERELWNKSIPALPRSMVPRWKRTLYEPRAGVLDAP